MQQITTRSLAALAAFSLSLVSIGTVVAVPPVAKGPAASAYIA